MKIAKTPDQIVDELFPGLPSNSPKRRLYVDYLVTKEDLRRANDQIRLLSLVLNATFVCMFIFGYKDWRNRRG